MKKKTLMELAIEKLKSCKGYEDHSLPKTRRDFIRMGLIAGGGYLLPSPLISRALAATPTAPDIPFLVFDLEGGAALPGNFLVGQKDGPEDLCQNYKKHGWNPRAGSSLDRTFGLPMSAQSSQILAGLKQALPSAVLEKSDNSLLQMGSICNFSFSDVPDNKASALSLVSKAGLRGKYLKAPLGQRSTFLSGGYSQALHQESIYRPKTITQLKDILNLTSLGERFFQLSSGEKRDIHSRLSKAGQQFPELAAAYQELAEFGNLHNIGDPTTSVEMTSAYNLAGVGDQSDVMVQAGIVYNVLQGYSGPGVITIGGCDYHVSDPNVGAVKDLEIGVAIGRAINAAYQLKKPLFFQILTDGGIYAKDSDYYERIWAGDENLHSLTVVGFFDPNGGVNMRKLQIGHYSADAELVMDTYVGKKPENMVHAVLANYLQANGLLGQMEQLTGIRIGAVPVDELLLLS